MGYSTAENVYVDDEDSALPIAEMETGEPIVRVACLAGDTRVEALDLRRYRLEVLREKPYGETVCLVADAQLLAGRLDEILSPALRLIAISEQPFEDPRLHAAIYAYVPPQTPIPFLERMIGNAASHLRLAFELKQDSQRLAGVVREIRELNRIGTALSAEHDVHKLLELILTKSREITQADAGSLYIIESSSESGVETKRLRFRVAQNDSLHVPFRETAMAIDESSIAGYVALHGATVRIDDCYNIASNLPYRINRKFDEDSGYRTKSILAVPMRNPNNQIEGVVQLINAKRQWTAPLHSAEDVAREVVPFTEMQTEVALSLASQAAVAYENSQLYLSIQQLFEGFVKASVVAIESRDPSTCGHSFRVANLTVAMAEYAERDERRFPGLHFSREQMREIRYASLLHDFGKVGVREQVLVKAKKLYPEQREMLIQRFELARLSLQEADQRERLEFVLRHGRASYAAEKAGFDQRLRENRESLERALEFILAADEPSVLPQGSFEQLTALAAMRYQTADGEPHPLLTSNEIGQLSIRKGSLDQRERAEIESHVSHTYNFLRQIPWTRELRNIPQIALAHHEKLNGSGYPHRWQAPEIPIQTRMMTIADIFDALAAVDRPYKKAVPLEKALEILQMMADDGELDSELVRLFREAKVYDRWQVEPIAY
jgi:HD-GYP domain-containing protein (c-di-GMP phosphodiesterase class II)